MILINANNIKQGGGLSVLMSFLSFFKKSDNDLVIIVPNNLIDNLQIKEFENEKNFIFRYVPSNFLYRVFFYNFFVKKICNIYNVNKIYTLGNIALKIEIYQVLLIQNAFPFIEDDAIINRFPLKFRLYIKLMSKAIIRQVKYANVVFVQTNVIKKCLNLYYSNLDIRIFPNVQNIPYCNNDVIPIISENINCLFLSNYYPHKNFEILFGLIPKINELKLPIKITITLSESEVKSANLNSLLLNYPNIFVNIGPVSYSEIEVVYSSYNAIFLPSLVESFSTNYVEALYFKKIIITSDLPFAREICNDLAFYFNPFDFTSAIGAFSSIINSPELISSKFVKYNDRITDLNLNNSNKTFKSFLDA